MPKSTLSFSVICFCGITSFAVGNGDGVSEEAPERSDDEWFVFWEYLTCHQSLLFYVSICQVSAFTQ